MRSKKHARHLALAAGTLLLTLGASAARQSPAAQKTTASESKPAHDTLLQPSDLQSLLPATVFFQGQSAPLQIRNASGIHFIDGAYLFASLVDNSGYSSGIQERYQAYFITEAAVQFGSRTLPAGAYGVGFISGNKFLVMDIGGHDVFTIDSTRDEALRHPTPLRIVQAPEAGRYRLYAGRSYVTFARSK